MKIITLQVTDELYAQIKTNAEETGVSEATAAVLCIENFFGMCRASDDDYKREKK